MSGARLHARGVAKRFGRAAALRDLDLDLEPGTGLALLGPNGAGKSTLLRLLAGLARPSRGVLEIDGRPAAHRLSRSRVGYVGHATGLSPDLSVRENLIFAARLHGQPDPAGRADAALEREGLAPLAARPARALSRGQAQRLAIARALLHEPPLVLLDEPFSGLDGRAAEGLTARLAELRRAGHTAVLATHALEPLRVLADRALLLDAGRASWSGALASDADRAALDGALERALAGDGRAA